jgi:hypothetical protein
MSSPGQSDLPLTRMEIIEHTEEAFAHPPVTVEELLDAARRRDARPEVLGALRSLPHRNYRGPVELWPHLPSLPVDR